MPAKTGCRIAIKVVRTAAFASEQAGLEQKTAGQQTVADIQKQMQIAAAAVFQFKGLIARERAQSLKQRLMIQPATLPLQLCQSVRHASDAAVHPRPSPAHVAPGPLSLQSRSAIALAHRIRPSHPPIVSHRIASRRVASHRIASRKL